MDGHDKNDAAGSADNLDKSNASGTAKGIFSTPNLTVNTENLPQNQPVKPAGSAARFNFGRRANRGGANAESSERVASAFAQTDASQQTQRLNEAMLENANAATQSTATGDIQLDVPKKRKKWPWLVLVLLVIAAVGALVFFVFANRHESVSVADVKAAFDLYDKEITDGTEHTDCVTQDEMPALEYMGTFNCSSELQDAVVNDMVDSYKSFKSLFDKSVLMDNEDLKLLVEHQSSYLEVVAQYLSPSIRINKIIQLYNIGESKITVEKVGSIQTDGLGFDAILKKFADVINTETINFISEYQAYNDSGCLLTGELDNECAALVAQTDALEEVYDQQDDIAEELEKLFRQISSQMIEDCNKIRELLHE